MKYQRGVFDAGASPIELDLLQADIFPICGIVSNGEWYGLYDAALLKNRYYERNNQLYNADDQIAPYGQKFIFKLVDSERLKLNGKSIGKEATDVWAVPSLIDSEHLTNLSKAWNGWTQPADSTGLGDNPFGLGSAIRLLNLVVVVQEDRSKYGHTKSKFVLSRFQLLVDMETTTEEDILRLLGWNYSQDPKEFHIGHKSLGHPDNPVPKGMEGYTYKSDAALFIVGADKFIYFPNNTLIGDDGIGISLNGMTTVTGETLLNQRFNPVTLEMRGNESYPILEKKTPLGKQKVKIDESGCLITRIAPYQSNVPRGAWFY